MADKDFQVVLHGLSGLPADDFVNVLHFDTSGDVVEDVCDGIHAAYVTLNTGGFHGGVNGMTIKVYPPGPNPGGPEFTKDYSFSYGSESVTEIALCLSYSATEDFEGSTPRQRGRIYLGPIQTGQLAVRPPTALRNRVLDFGEDLAQVGFASQTTWKMFSRANNAYLKIEGISVDDAWDTQRRRGLAPTSRTSRDVQ